MGEVVGVVKNFHYNSLEHAIEPVCMFSNLGRFSKISIRYQGNTEQALATIEKNWKQQFPASYFDFAFFDESVEKQYNSLQRFTTLFRGFSILCVFIAMMGLFGLVSYTTSQRKKEIGIRKVHGASVGSIVWLINAELVLLIGIASLIAAPTGWLVMEQWLANFAYKTDMSIWWTLLAGLVVVSLAVLSGIFQSLKSAIANPINSLRSE